MARAMFAKGIGSMTWGSQVLLTSQTPSKHSLVSLFLMLAYIFVYFPLAFHELPRTDVDLRGRARFGLKTFLILVYRKSSFSTVSLCHIVLNRKQILFCRICIISFRKI